MVHGPSTILRDLFRNHGGSPKKNFFYFNNIKGQQEKHNNKHVCCVLKMFLDSIAALTRCSPQIGSSYSLTTLHSARLRNTVPPLPPSPFRTPRRAPGTVRGRAVGKGGPANAEGKG